jgi:hypothetical protein
MKSFQVFIFKSAAAAPPVERASLSRQRIRGRAVPPDAVPRLSNELSAGALGQRHECDARLNQMGERDSDEANGGDPAMNQFLRVRIAENH